MSAFEQQGEIFWKTTIYNTDGTQVTETTDDAGSLISRDESVAVAPEISEDGEVSEQDLFVVPNQGEEESYGDYMDRLQEWRQACDMQSVDVQLYVLDELDSWFGEKAANRGDYSAYSQDGETDDDEMGGDEDWAESDGDESTSFYSAKLKRHVFRSEVDEAWEGLTERQKQQTSYKGFVLRTFGLDPSVFDDDDSWEQESDLYELTMHDGAV